MQTKVTFFYNESSRKWEVIVTGVLDSLEALQAFNAVILTSQKAIPQINANKAEFIGVDEFHNKVYKIFVGV